MWLPLALACRPEPSPRPEPPDGVVHSAAPLVHSATTGLGHTGTTGATGDSAPPGEVFDCATITAPPFAQREVEGPRGYHDLAFLQDGGVLGTTSGGDLARGDAYGALQVLVPRTGLLEQLAWLPDGDLAVASFTGVMRVTMAGSVTPIAPDVRPYGLILGPDGRLWAADQRVVVAIDPNTGDVERILDAGALDRGEPRVIQFDLDYTHLFVGTYGGSQGRLYRVPLGADLRPTGPPEVFASGVGRGGYHDAIGIDVCGYLYVPDYDTSNLYRVSPEGDVELLLDSGFLRADYPHGLEWGLGLGGFRHDALYLPQPYDRNRVLELVIGVPSREWTGGTAINLPPGASAQ
jgi:hypothetical protein